MIKLYPGFYLFLVFTYLAGRLGMVLIITDTNEDKRYINFQVIPKSISREIAAAFHKEEKIKSHNRKQFFFKFKIEENVFTGRFYFGDLLPTSFIYSGHYIDPPKLA
jgi:hypothetical protein